MAKGFGRGRPSAIRKRFVEQARLHHLLMTISSLYFGPSGSWWTGDEAEGGRGYDNHQGDAYVAQWNAEGLVVLVFAHESSRSEFETPVAKRKPLKRLPRLPASLAPLAEEIAESMERLATSGLWLDATQVVTSDGWGTRAATLHGLEMLAGYERTARDAIQGRGMLQGWGELSSLGADQLALAKELAGRTKGRVKAQEGRVLLQVVEDCPPDRESIPDVLEGFAEVGLTWKVDWKQVERLEKRLAQAEAKRLEAATRGQPAGAAEILEAARAGDVKAIRALALRDPELLNARTVDDQFQYTPAGDTPLIQAIKQEAYAAAGVLLELGADPTPANRFGQTALHWAVREGRLELVEALLTAGAEVDAREEDGGTALHDAAADGLIEIAERLLAAGASRRLKRMGRMTPAEQARISGHPRLEKLLR